MKEFFKKEFEESIRLSNTEGAETTVNESDASFITDSVSIGKVSFSAAEVLSLDVDGYQSAYDDWVADSFLADRLDLIATCSEDAVNKERLDTLAEVVEKRNVIPYVGAGFSVPSSYPRWKKFLEDVAQEVGYDLSRLADLLKAGKYELAAEEVEAAATGGEFDERCEEKFKVRMGTRIQGAVCLLPYVFEEMVITTNFDPVLETVYERCDLPFSFVHLGAQCDILRQLYTDRAHVLHKLHGDYLRPSTRILTQSEFDRYYDDPKLPFRADFEDLVLHRSLLFLGCSLSIDRPLKVIRDAFSRDRNMPRHYAYIELLADDSEKQARKQELLEANIFPIWYGTQEEAENDEIDRDMYNQALMVYLATRRGTASRFTI